ncbi:GNAT family N-acetyltransferase [Algoriphagus sp. AK58]|uniref:GNAT family N-acetyltransferase n=1 Tax=Algoriphagus sp. AK58 TaxID=1406877 RepID=UPI0016500770|nr:GNAT family N-acetyltransferase [Algoriphagus sp. AK58]MBC6366728.1 GNAT family N-acetyltransferase [Algoriphagus sp. AK58]
MAQIRIAKTAYDLQGILDLQWENHLSRVSDEVKQADGFVTVRHTPEQLLALQSIAPHVIALEEDQVVGYILAMTKASRDLIPVLVPMFDQFDQISYRDKKISDYEYMVVGQVCVAKDQRGKGLFDQMYEAYKNQFFSQFSFAITEIAKSNTRSLAAHRRVGFEVIHEFEEVTQSWAIVAWDWK